MKIFGWQIGSRASAPVAVPKSCETIPNLQHDPNRPEDVLKVDCDESGLGGDDCADALRYLVATRRGGGVAVGRV